MKKKGERSFKSLEEIQKVYMPKQRAKADAVMPDDPKKAGKRLAEKVVATMQTELAKRLRGKRGRK